ncbi:MAG TPA: hypothetical protein VKV37_19505 [Ktedonobacteraceae bacterium]|jgi:hypothetical protein|nr:hypothetical protein [Ktedonobacteraceae bacterium]
MQTENWPGHELEEENLRNLQDSTEKRPRVGNPTTPVPRRASALPPGAIRVRPRYPRNQTAPVDNDITRIPTLPQTTLWQYESDDYEAESSLASLSLVVSETPRRSTDRLEWEIDEIDTNPISPSPSAPAPRVPDTAAAQARDALADIDTARLDAVPPVAKDTRPRSQHVEGELASWTAGGGANSPYAQRIVSHERPAPRRSLWLRPLDNMRWWLLYPGRIEFLLWLVGTLLLMSATLILLLTGVLSLGLLNNADRQYEAPAPGPVSSAVTPLCAGPISPKGGKSCASPAPRITVLNGGPLAVGVYMQIHGQGFSPYGPVKFSHDASLPCYPATAQADGHGEFFVFLVSGYGPGWHAGRHSIIAYDVMSRRATSLEVTLSAPSSG